MFLSQKIRETLIEKAFALSVRLLLSCTIHIDSYLKALVLCIGQVGHPQNEIKRNPNFRPEVIDGKAAHAFCVGDPPCI